MAAAGTDDEKARWVARVLGFRFPAAAATGQETTAPGGGSEQEGPAEAELNLGELREWLDDLRAQAAPLQSPEGAALLARARTLREALASADLPKSVDDVAALARDIALANRAARMAQARAQSADRVTRTRLQRQWLDAHEQARTTLQGFVATLIADTDLQKDERYPRLKAAEQALGLLLPDDGGQLGKALAEVDDANDPGDVRAARDRALGVLRTYSGTLEQDENLRQMQKIADDAFDGAPFLNGLKVSLAALDAQLEKPA